MRKGEFSKMVVTKELYKRFIEEFPEYEELTWREFYDSWLEIAEQIRHEAAFNPLGVKLGSYVGELKFQYLPYDFKAKDHTSGDGSDYINLVTKGKVGRVKWERRWAVNFNKMLQFYAFDGAREINELAYQRATQNPESIRVARNTLGGHSIWRQKTKNE
jgi:hypothetical protein